MGMDETKNNPNKALNNLDKALAHKALMCISSLKLDELDLYARENHGILEYLCDNGALHWKNIEEALEVAVIKQANSDYMSMMNTHTAAFNDAENPEALAYALRQNIFSDKEVLALWETHKDLSDFCDEHYMPQLLPCLRKRLLHPEPVSAGSVD